MCEYCFFNCFFLNLFNLAHFFFLSFFSPPRIAALLSSFILKNSLSLLQLWLPRAPLVSPVWTPWAVCRFSTLLLSPAPPPQPTLQAAVTQIAVSPPALDPTPLALFHRCLLQSWKRDGPRPRQACRISTFLRPPLFLSHLRHVKDGTLVYLVRVAIRLITVTK